MSDAASIQRRHMWARPARRLAFLLMIGLGACSNAQGMESHAGVNVACAHPRPFGRVGEQYTPPPSQLLCGEHQAWAHHPW